MIMKIEEGERKIGKASTLKVNWGKFSSNQEISRDNVSMVHLN